MKIENTQAADTNVNLQTVLLVDDSPVNLGVVVEGLERHGVEVLVAVDGEEALQRTEVATPDLILLDVMMPGMDGFEVCRKLKANDRTRDIPVIFMTSLNSTENKVKGFNAGGVDYVTKPLQVDEVRARVETHLKLRGLQKKLEEKNVKLQQEVKERKKAQAELKRNFNLIADLNNHLKMQTVELEASYELIRQTEEWYRDILRSAPDGMIVVNERGSITLINEHLEAMFGYTEEELLGQPMEILLPRDVSGGHVAKRDDFFASGLMGRPMGSMASGLRACRKDGSEFLVDVSLSRLPAVEGCVGEICATIRDMTERKRIGDELVAREQKLRTLVENKPKVCDAATAIEAS